MCLKFSIEFFLLKALPKIKNKDADRYSHVMLNHVLNASILNFPLSLRCNLMRNI